MRECLDGLSAEDRARYARLLTFDDMDLYEWLRGIGEVPDPDLRALVTAIRQAAAAPGDR